MMLFLLCLFKELNISTQKWKPGHKKWRKVAGNCIKRFNLNKNQRVITSINLLCVSITLKLLHTDHYSLFSVRLCRCDTSSTSSCTALFVVRAWLLVATTGTARLWCCKMYSLYSFVKCSHVRNVKRDSAEDLDDMNLRNVNILYFSLVASRGGVCKTVIRSHGQGSFFTFLHH